MGGTGIVVAFTVVVIGVLISLWKLDDIQRLASPYLSATSSNAAKKKPSGSTDRLFTVDELRRYDGSAGSPGLYLSILGQVFDVSKGAKHYGPGGGYHFFAAKDGTRAFVSGKFDDQGLTDDLSGLQWTEYIGIEDWVKFYKKDYKYVGKLIGTYFDETGNPTAKMAAYEENLQKAYVKRQEEADDRKRFPPCNSEWAQGKGGRLWCSNKSGGIERQWAGFPRRYFEPGKKSFRCACVNHDQLSNPQLKEYDNCHPTSHSCPMPDK